jgi:hypothetical protein
MCVHLWPMSEVWRIFSVSNRAVVQLGRTLEWGSRGRGFESRRPEMIKSSPCFTFMFCAATRPPAAMWDCVRIWMSVSGATISVIPKLRVTASHGLWSIVKGFVVAPKPQERSATISQVEVATNLINCNCRAVAASTGRGFESRRPERF